MKNKTWFAVFVVALVLLGIAFLAYGARDLFQQSVKATITVPLPVSGLVKIADVQNSANVVKENPVIVHEKANCVIKKPENVQKSYRTVSLHRIDFSGDYALPDGATVKAVYIDGQQAAKWSITGTGNLDVWESKPNSKITAVFLVQ